MQTAFRNIWKNSANRFIISFLGLFLLFYGFNTAFIGIVAPGGVYNAFLDQHFNYIVAWREFCIQSSAKILTVLGYKVFTNTSRLLVENHAGFKLIYTCLGYGVMSFFAAFVLAFPRPVKSKIIFLIAGLLMIQALNTARFILLALYWKRNLIPFGIDHHTIFNICIYAILLISIYLWVNSRPKKHAANPA